MFARIKEFFEGQTSLEVDKQGEPSNKDLQIATAVLLLEMALLEKLPKQPLMAPHRMQRFK